LIPILETPASDDSKHYLILESKIIIDFLDAKYPSAPLYSSNPFHRAEQDLMMQTFAEIDLNIMVLMFSRGKAKQSVAQLKKALDKIEGWLGNSKTGFFGFQIPKNTSRSSPHEQYDWDDNHNAGSLQ
jgi:glutathione S-transferase